VRRRASILFRTIHVTAGACTEFEPRAHNRQVSGVSRIIAAVFWFQAIGATVALLRLSRWRRLPPPLEPTDPGTTQAGITIVIPTLNEASRITPLLEGVQLQDKAVTQILFVDSRSTDGTRSLIEAAALRDSRIHLITDDPLPDGWIGKAWALECARKHVQNPWLLTLDADTAPRAGLAHTLVSTAEREGLDAISLGPRFAGQSPAERWLQPSILVSLLYRFPPSAKSRTGRVLANGQCFVVRREALEMAGGYASVRASFAEDVSLATHLVRRGARVAFLDGAHLYDVRSYASARQMWREWGRSIDLKDATTAAGQIFDVATIIAVQGIPLVVLVLAASARISVSMPIVALSTGLVLVRVLLLFVMKHSYAERGITYWLSPLSDPLAAIRLVLSSLRRPAEWRGRSYSRAARP
jgi:dolichol-phosphate mannosyltransferase